jgi:hypothetical protein
MCAYGLDELLYREAQREGVTFVRTKGEVVLDHGVPLQLRAEDDQSGYNVQVRPDILVLDDEALLPCTTTFTDLMARIDALDGPVSKGAASTMREGVYLALPQTVDCWRRRLSPGPLRRLRVPFPRPSLRRSGSPWLWSSIVNGAQPA